MKRSILVSMLFIAHNLYAMVPPAGGKGGGGLTAILPLIFIFLIFYFLLIMPQRQQRKKHQELLKNLKRGDKVVTSGGIHGTIEKIDKDTAVLKVSQKAELVVDKSVITSVIS